MARRGPWLLAALWVAAAVLATGVGVLAIQLVAGQVSEPGASALDDDAVGDALGSVTRGPTPSSSVVATPRSTPSRGAAPRPSTSPRGSSVGPLRTVTTPGGVVSARCVSGVPRLVLATPAEGYRTDDSSGTRVRFESSRHEVTVRLGCTASNRIIDSVRIEDRDDEPSPSPSPSREPSPEPSESEHPSPEPSDDD